MKQIFQLKFDAKYSVLSNFKWKIFSNFVAFSEYPNFNDKEVWITFKMCSYIYARILHTFRIHSISYNIDHRWSSIGFVYWDDMYGFTLLFEVKNTVLGSPGSSIISRTQNIYAWKNRNKSSNRFWNRRIEKSIQCHTYQAN